MFQMFAISFIGLQSRFGDKLLGIRVVCPPNGTAALNGLTGGWVAPYSPIIIY